MKKPKKSEDLGVKLGSDDMVFWRNIIDSQKREVDNIKKSLKFSSWLVEKAEKEFEKAEKEFNNK